MHPSCMPCLPPALAVSFLFCNLYPSCPAFIRHSLLPTFTCIHPVLHLSCPVSFLPCMHPAFILAHIYLHLSCPAFVLSCIRPALYPIYITFSFLVTETSEVDNLEGQAHFFAPVVGERSEPEHRSDYGCLHHRHRRQHRGRRHSTGNSSRFFTCFTEISIIRDGHLVKFAKTVR